MNGRVKEFLLERGKLIGNGCKLPDMPFASNDFEKIITKNLTTASLGFFYDQTNEEYIYIDSSSELSTDFAYYAYRISIFNSVGVIESEWSKAFLSWQKRPTPPVDLKINQADATGFTLKFKEPTNFNGNLIN